MNDQNDDVKTIDVSTAEQAMDILFEHFMNGVNWFNSGLGKGIDQQKLSHFILWNFAQRLNYAEDSRVNHTEGEIKKPEPIEGLDVKVL